MANKTTKPRFDPQWATGLVLLGALGFSVGVGLRAYQVPENPVMVAQVASQAATVQPVKPQPIKLQKITPQSQPQVSQQPRVVRVVRTIRRPVVVTRGS